MKARAGRGAPRSGFEGQTFRSISSRLGIAIPLGLLLGAFVWIMAAAGVHAYESPRLQWLLLFPAALFDRGGLVIHFLQWIAYAFLLVSIAKYPNRRTHLKVASLLLTIHLLAGLVTARPI